MLIDDCLHLITNTAFEMPHSESQYVATKRLAAAQIMARRTFGGHLRLTWR